MASTSPVRDNPSQADSAALHEALRQRVHREVRFDNSSRALYSSDGSNYRQVPIGVVIPRDNDDVIATIATCREHRVPVLCRGGGTSLAGQCCNVAVVLDFSKYMANILELDPERRIARVQPGVILDHLRAAAEKHNLTFGPDPASHSRCTLGGMIGNNSCGVHSVMAGKTDQNIEELEVLTYGGLRLRVGQTSQADLDTIIAAGDRRANIYAGLRRIRDQYGDLVRQKYPNIPRRVSGYNLNYLLPENGFHVARALVGSEGTCVTTLEATCRLVTSPPERLLLVIGCRDVFECADLVPEVLQHKPIGLEGMDDVLVEYTRRKGINPEGVSMLPEGRGWLLAEFGGWTPEEAKAKAEGLMQALAKSSSPKSYRLFPDKAQARKVWEVREASLGAVSKVPGEPPLWEGWEDAAVAPEKLGAYLRDMKKMTDDFGYQCVLYGHFGDGCVHNRISFDLQSTDGIAKFRRYMEEAADLVVSYGGSVSGEHGDGQARAELYPKMFGPELVKAFEEFKGLWDPDWKMNPGKVVLPNKMDADLRLGADYNPWQPKLNFSFPQDHGSLAEATMRCVGVGKCRQYEGGVMCPSFRVTREEKHSTRGRAHLLWEMTLGGTISGKWNDEDVKSSLDLCLSCKGCKSDCPVGVDVASYKAEFLSHYYERNSRSLNHSAFGQIGRWARVASHVPWLANFLGQTPGFREVGKSILGVAPQRQLPRFADQTFVRWFRKHDGKSKLPLSTKSVLLWPDTFNNYFDPESAIAAVEVLEAAGFDVRLPRHHVCCGRPLYDFGMLDRAKRQLIKTMNTLRAEIDAGVPIVVLEPSCASVFKDELLNFFPEDSRAQKLSQQVVLLSEFLQQHHVTLPRLKGSALLHGHCHQKSIQRMTSEELILRQMRVNFTAPAQGCCGMAGAFGFEKDKYDVSLAIGELELLPAVRNASPETFLIADGFSCREQIEQCTGRKVLHLAKVLRMAMKQ
ncbi:MAG TPA: FAD-linked oxidase C-terminal domain-containing protein [Terriglobales bacterium]|nr:FAD-linked oxidase C-terminal domain-containing protein [Terriglobales bacterium]